MYFLYTKEYVDLNTSLATIFEKFDLGYFWLWVHISPKPVRGEGSTSSQGLSDRAACTAQLVPTLGAILGSPVLLNIFGPARRTPNVWDSSITRWHMWAVLVWLAEDKPSSEVSPLNVTLFYTSVVASGSRMHLMHPNLPSEEYSFTIFFCLFPEKTTPLSQSSPQLLSQPAICLVLMQPSLSCQGWDYKSTRYPALIWCQDFLVELWKTFPIAGSWPCCPSSQISAITSLLFLSVNCRPLLIFWLFFWRRKPMCSVMEMRTLAIPL